jgi:DNA-directed RNA polymerase specialized sigma24 family protein
MKRHFKRASIRWTRAMGEYHESRIPNVTPRGQDPISKFQRNQVLDLFFNELEIRGVDPAVVIYLRRRLQEPVSLAEVAREIGVPETTLRSRVNVAAPTLQSVAREHDLKDLLAF